MCSDQLKAELDNLKRINLKYESPFIGDNVDLSSGRSTPAASDQANVFLNNTQSTSNNNSHQQLRLTLFEAALNDRRIVFAATQANGGPVLNGFI